MSKTPKIATLIPTRGLIFTQTMNAVLRELGANGQYPVIYTTDDLPIPECRTALAEDVLKDDRIDYTHFLLIDDDVVMPKGGLEAMLEKDTDIAFIDYPMHYDKGKFKNMGTACYDEWTEGEDVKGKPVKWAGLGCTLVKREVFEEMDKPWFASRHKAFERDEDGKISFIGDMPTGETGGEDTHFFMEAKKAGFEIEPVHELTAGHARVEKFVRHLQSGKYSSQHKIKVNSKVERPFK